MKAAVMRNNAPQKMTVQGALAGNGSGKECYWKTNTLNKREFPLFPYPNAASRREIAHKIVDSLLIFACCAAMAAAFLLMVAIA